MNSCILCSRDLEPCNLSEVCGECRLIVANLVHVRVEERWRPVAVAGTEGVLVSDFGRIARLPPIDRNPLADLLA